MSRHIIDRPTRRGAGAMKSAFLRIDRQERTHPGIEKLSRQPKHQLSAGRLRQFARIDRGQKA